MKKIGLRKQLYEVTKLPKEVVDVIRKTISVLEENYGSDRNIDEDMGGYILIIEDISDFQQLNDELYLDIENDVIPEFVDLIKCNDGQIFTNTLILCNNDFGISVIMPLDITPDNLKEYIVE